MGNGVETMLVLAITALAGGAFGAAIGALPAFVFTGFVVFLGEGLEILESSVGSLAGIEATALDVGLTGSIGFGVVFGPHVAFAGGVAASAYMGKQYPEQEPNGWDYHPGKVITEAYGTQPDILAVGAAFGLLGHVIERLAVASSIPTDPIALSVVATALLARLAFGYPLIGTPAGDSWFDMRPFQNGDRQPLTDGGTERTRLATEPWLAHQYRWSGVTTIGIIGGLLGGYIWMETGSIFLGYALSTMSLTFLTLGVAKIPVTHHITLLGSVGAVLAAELTGSVVLILLVGGLFGTISGLIGEITQRVLYAHSGTHVDPPAMAITVCMVVVGVGALLGVIPTAAYL
ncbi:hypothetical protein [Halocatena halophila]|uniref:hypothetical protein n=1 Tax=Halocatena halophila TaxID=2814576 RepID=UPI0038B3C1BC